MTITIGATTSSSSSLAATMPKVPGRGRRERNARRMHIMRVRSVGIYRVSIHVLVSQSVTVRRTGDGQSIGGKRNTKDRGLLAARLRV